MTHHRTTHHRTTHHGTTHHFTRLALLVGATALAGCGDPTSSSSASTVSRAALLASLASVPVGYGDLTSSYVGTPAAGAGDDGVWVGGGRDARFGGGALMGGGLQDAFVGGVAFEGGHHGHRGPFGGGLPCAGTFDAATGRVTCATETRNGLTIARTAAYADAAGQAQSAFDSLTTNSVNLHTEVTGTVSFTRGADSSVYGGPWDGEGGHGGPDDHGHGGPDSTSGTSAHHAGGAGGQGGVPDSANGGGGGPDGPGGHHGHGGWGVGRGDVGRLLGDTSTILTASTTVKSVSDRTVSGLAEGSTQRTVEGMSEGEESTTGTSSSGEFTATRAVADTTRGLVIPLQNDAATYPTAGTVIRVMQASLTYAGQQTVTVSRREVVTYDGSATAQVTITENGETRSCTRPLPRGELSCQ